MKINPYIDNQLALIAKLQTQKLSGYTNQKGGKANWKNHVWVYTAQNKQTINYYFIKFSKKRVHIRSDFSKSQILPTELKKLLMAFPLPLIASPVSNSDKRKSFLAARKFVSKAGNPAYVTLTKLLVQLEKMKTPSKMNVFFCWLHEHKLVPRSLVLPQFKSRTRLSGDDIIANKKTNLPAKNVLLALGAIFHETIPLERKNWKSHPLFSQRDAFVCVMSSLAMSAPNRIAAEQTILPVQKLIVKPITFS